jgi:P22 coat protein - gene protein 5.
MGNVLDAHIPRVLAAGLATFRSACVMPGLVNSDYSEDAAEKGDVIRVAKSVKRGTSAVTPSNVYPALNDTEDAYVDIKLDYWQKSDPFHVTDKDTKKMDKNKNFIPMAVHESARALAEYVNERILEAAYIASPHFTGTASAVPFASGIGDATALRKMMQKLRMPKSGRVAVMDPDAMANALTQPQFSSLETTGDSAVKIEGELGRKFGINWYEDQQVPTHTKGTASGTLVAANAAAGATTVATDTGTGTFKKGDIIVFENDTTTYVVLADVANVGAGSLSVYPALQAPVSDGDTILFATNFGTSVQNLGFVRESIAFATRSLADEDIDKNLGSRIMTMQDPDTGLVLRLEVYRPYKTTVWEFDVLFGTEAVRPEGIVRHLGQAA